MIPKKLRLHRTSTERLKKKLSALERVVEQHRIGIPMHGTDNLPEDDASQEKHVLDASVIPLITLARSLNDILCKAFESYVVTGDSDEKIKRLIAWVYDNFDKNRHSAMVSLKELEKEFD